MGERPRISSRIVGAEVGPIDHAVDARWLMAYAAGIGERGRRYYDTLGAQGPVAHPLFPVSYEWTAALALRARTIDSTLGPLAVHATHHVRIHRSPRAGDTVRTSARVVSVSRRRSGTLVVTRFTTVDQRGEPVTTTDSGTVYRGVDCAGEASVADAPPALPAIANAPVEWTEPVDVAAGTAHVYTECARIWNPIHTDLAVARAAGLPGLILHGTATLALAVSAVIVRHLGGDPWPVTEVAGRFTGMVALSSRFTVRGRGPVDGAIAFDAIAPDGRPVLSDGRLGYDGGLPGTP
jgi:acyl dehydratase